MPTRSGLTTRVFQQGAAGQTSAGPVTISGRRRCPIEYLRVYADAEGESHFSVVQLAAERVEEPGRGLVADLSEAIDAGAVVFRHVLEEPTDEDYPHVAPRRQFIVQLSGEAEIRVSDGEVRRLSPGSVVLLEDTTGKGHVTRRLSSEGRMTLVITLPD